MDWQSAAFDNAAFRNLQEHLSVEKFINDLKREVDLPKCPLLSDFVERKQRELSNDDGIPVDKREHWRRLTALFGLLHHSFLYLPPAGPSILH
jgi:hypothetical protein